MHTGSGDHTAMTCKLSVICYLQTTIPVRASAKPDESPLSNHPSGGSGIWGPWVGWTREKKDLSQCIDGDHEWRGHRLRN